MLFLLILVILACMRIINASLLDILNFIVASSSECPVFHAGLEGLPKSTEIFPELISLEQGFSTFRAELDAFLVQRPQINSMQQIYNHMFLNAAVSSKRKWFSPILKQGWRLLYGSHLDIFNNIASKEWKITNLILYGHIIPKNAQYFPLLTECLAKMDCV